jgi:hypothetical protein
MQGPEFKPQYHQKKKKKEKEPIIMKRNEIQEPTPCPHGDQKLQ